MKHTKEKIKTLKLKENHEKRDPKKPVCERCDSSPDSLSYDDSHPDGQARR